MIDVSVIIVSYNTRQMTLDCLRDLYADVAASGLAVETFVVDNASKDGSAAAVRAAYPQVRVIENNFNAGFGAANNQALRLAEGHYVMLLNSDAFPRPGAVETLVAYLDGHPRVGVAAPRLLNGDGSLQPSVWPFPSPARAWVEAVVASRLFAWSWGLRDWRRWAHDRTADVPWAIGACLLVRREAVDAAGLFDENFFLYGEETDWELRIRRAGWAVHFVREAEVVHLAGASGRRQPDAVFDEFRRGQERFARKHYGRVGLEVYRGAVLVGSGTRALLFAAHARLRRSTDSARKADLAARIFWWTLGRRGPGLGRQDPPARDADVIPSAGAVRDG